MLLFCRKNPKGTNFSGHSSQGSIEKKKELREREIQEDGNFELKRRRKREVNVMGRERERHEMKRGSKDVNV